MKLVILVSVVMFHSNRNKVNTLICILGTGLYLMLKGASKEGRSDQIRSVAQSCPTLCNPMNRSTPGLPVNLLPNHTPHSGHRSV